MDRPQSLSWIVPAVLVVAAGLLTLVAIASQPGGVVGTTPDGVSYLGAAENLGNGRGLTGAFATTIDRFSPAEAAAFDGRVPFVQWPPLFPALLGVPAALGADPRQAAGLFNALLFGLSTGGVGWVTARLSGSVLAGLAAGGLLLVQPDAVVLHLVVASEPLYVVLTLAALWLATRALTAPSVPAVAGSATATRWLVAALAMAGAASLTRLIGVSLVAAIALAWLVWGPEDLRRRSWQAGVGGLAAVLPALAWMQWTGSQAGRPARVLAWHPPGSDHWELLRDTFLGWFVRPDAATAWRGVVLVAVVAVVALAVVGWRSAREKDASRRLAQAWWRVSALAVPLYLVALVATHTFFDRGVPVGGRLVLPLLPLLLPLLVGGAVRGLRVLGAGRALPPFAFRAAGAVLLMGAVAIAAPLAATSRDVATPPAGGGPVEEVSGTAVRLRQLPPDVLIASNDPSLAWLSAGRETIAVPTREWVTSGHRNERFDEHLAELGSVLEDDGGVVVLYDDTAALAAHYVTEPELLERNFQVVDRTDEAVVLAPEGSRYATP